MDPASGEGTAGTTTATETAPTVESKRAEILARVRAQRGGSEPSGPHTPVRAGSTPASATEDTEAEEDAPAEGGEKPTETEGDDKPKDEGEESEPATARIAALTKKVAELEKLTSRAKVADEYEALKDKIKRSPAAIFDAFPDLNLEVVSEDFLKRQENPAHAQLTEQEKKTAALEGEIAKLRGEISAKETAAAERSAHAQGAELLTADADRWPIASREENRVEAVSEAMKAARLVAAKMKGTIPEDKAQEIFRACLDEAEKDMEARGQRYSRPHPKTGEKPRLRTIASPAGSAGDGARKAPVTKPLTKEEILARVRREAKR